MWRVKKLRLKYGNKPTERILPDGSVIKFDSRKEAGRYDELRLLLWAGEIKDLKLQHEFTLKEAYTTTDGKRMGSIRYKADFTYKRKVKEGPDTRWVFTVEDVKSRATKTTEYEMKKKLMHSVHGLEIVEVGF